MVHVQEEKEICAHPFTQEDTIPIINHLNETKQAIIIDIPIENDEYYTMNFLISGTYYQVTDKQLTSINQSPIPLVESNFRQNIHRWFKHKVRITFFILKSMVKPK